MGCNARLYASGPYSKEIAPHLNYPNNFYNNIKKNTPIFTSVCVMNTNDGSRELAEALGIELFPGVVVNSQEVLERLPALWELVENPHYNYLTLTDYGTIKHLAEAGFTFYFDPNG